MNYFVNSDLWSQPTCAGSLGHTPPSPVKIKTCQSPAVSLGGKEIERVSSCNKHSRPPHRNGLWARNGSIFWNMAL